MVCIRENGSSHTRKHMRPVVLIILDAYLKMNPRIYVENERKMIVML